MAGPQLNADVLSVVCEFLSDVSDVRYLALTCSSVYPIAIRWLISMRPVYLKSGPPVRRFHSFLRAGAQARSPHVRAMHIDLRSPEDPQTLADDLPLFLDILNTCKCVEHITLAFGEASQHVAVDPRIVQAITDVPRLRSFSIRSRNLDLSADTPALLLHLSAHLRSLSLRLQNGFLSFWYPAALGRVLPHVARTLENLEIAKFTVDPLVIQAGTHIPSPPIASLMEYPAVRSLSVESLEGRPLVEDLQHLFPALDSTLSLGALDIRCREETYTHIRAANQRAQEHNKDGFPSRSRPWTRLDRVICTGQMLYVLGLRCPIRLAMVDFGLSKYARYVADALRENPVLRLKLTLGHDLAALDHILSPPLARTLTHLTLCLLYSNSCGYPELEDEEYSDVASPRYRWENVLGGIVSAIQPLHKLAQLCVVIGVSLHVCEDTPPPYAPSDEYALCFRESRFDFEGAAAALARALGPSLQNVFIMTRGFFSIWEGPGPDVAPRGRFTPYERWCTSRGWRVAIMPGAGGGGAPGGEQGVDLVELHEDVAETIVRKEELILSEMDEKYLHLKYGWHVSPPPLRV